MPKDPPAAPAAAPVGNAIFPSAVDPQYSKESASKARMHTCIDQYNKNKSTNANGGLKWIEKGGGFYGKCNKRLGGILSGPVLTQDGEEPDGPSFRARGAHYTVEEDPANQGKADDKIPFKCVYRNKEKFLCPDTERIAFEKHYRTRTMISSLSPGVFLDRETACRIGSSS